MTRQFGLSEIAEVLRARGLLIEVLGSEDVVVRGVSQDSRSVAPGDLFLAWEGVETDAHLYVRDAAEAGATAAVVEREVAVDLPQLVVTDGRLASALTAHLVLGSPGDELQLVAVTGTNGKTTTALILRQVLGNGTPVATIGTLGLVEPDGRVRKGTEGLTTPGPVQLSTWLRSLADAGVRAVTIEASSHALEQKRLDGLRFDAGVFTNLGHDHLDYHADLASYRSAKLRLLDLLRSAGTAVVNADEGAWSPMPEHPRRLTFSIADPSADLRAEDLEVGAEGSTFTLSYGGERCPVRLPLLGRFNVENALAAVGAALSLGVSLEEAGRRLEGVTQVPGRLERVVDVPTVLIDFAHTPDALDTVLETVKPLVEGRLWVVFGAGGDRDRGKRRPMAEAVSRYADAVVLTSDNPRTEDPEGILDDLEEGLASVPYERIADRREAICRALREAAPGDLILLAGKGHETYQVIGAEKLPFDERTVVQECLERRGAA